MRPFDEFEPSATATSDQTQADARPESAAAADRVAAMAERFGLLSDDLALFVGLEDHLVDVCAGCAEAGACEKAMAGAAAFPISCCPNAKLYAVLAQE